jgi:hypothetical protein
MDEDDDLDCLIGDKDGTVHYLRNDGNTTVPRWTYITSDYFESDVGAYSAPFCALIRDFKVEDSYEMDAVVYETDKDKDQVCLVGNQEGNVYRYQKINGAPFQPSFEPSPQPSLIPTVIPTLLPTTQPSLQPTTVPTTVPTLAPSERPSLQPTSFPSLQPTPTPTPNPTPILTAFVDTIPRTNVGANSDADTKSFPCADHSSYAGADFNAILRAH